MSEKLESDHAKKKEMQERARERNLITREIQNRGPLTVEELSKTIMIEKPRLMKHLIAMRQFGKIQIVGERDDQFVYGLPKENT